MDEGFTCPAEAGGGYYSSRGNDRGGDDERRNKGDPLPLRLRTDYDGAEPGAGSVAVDNLMRLSGYLRRENGAQLRRKAAEHLAAAYARPETPQTFPEMTASLVTAILGPKQVIIAGDPATEGTRALVTAAQRSFCPNLVLILADATARADSGGVEGSKKVEDYEEGPLVRDVLDTYGGGYKLGERGMPAAYVCFDNSCMSPVHTAEALQELLD